jgi:hypothetical protein
MKSRRLMMIAMLLTVTLVDGQTKRAEAQKGAATELLHAEGVRLLEGASAEAGSFELASQAALLFAIGQTYSAFDKTKARAAYEAAYQNMRVSLENRPEIVGFLAPDLIMGTVEVAPDAVEQSLPQARFRDFALSALAKRHSQRKQWDRAIELLLMMESDENMAVPARDLLMALPRSRQDNRDHVFAAVLRAYTQVQHHQVGTGNPEDLGTLVVRFWRSLNPAVVHQAIDELLKQAKDGDSIVMNSPQGTVTFSSYQFRLFQVLPALKAIDPDEASALLKQENETAAILKKYPQGQQSVDPWLRDTPLQDGEQRQTKFAYLTNFSASAPVGVRMETDRTIDDLIASADTDPNGAIASALRITDRVTRLRVLVGIAQASGKRNASTAKAALREALKSPPEEDESWKDLKDAAEVALQLNDSDIADSAVKSGLKVARRLYDEDADSDNPNEALKLYWPSVRAYRELIAVQAKISPDAALATVRSLPDVEVGALEKVMLAAAMLKAPLTETSPMVAKKHDTTEH